MRQKNAAWRLWRSDRDNPTHYASFSRLRRLCKKNIVNARQAEVRSAFGDCTSIAEFWRTYRRLNNAGGKEELTLPGTLPGELCGVVSEFFHSVWNSVSVSPPLLVPGPVPPEACPTFREVEASLLKLNVNKSTGGDGIPAVLLKRCADVLASSLSHLYRRSLQEACVPSDWRDAVVSPIPKVTNPLLPGDYRPISLLPICSKDMEKHVMRLLLPHVLPHLPDWQFGFRRGRGTADCLAFVTHELGTIVDKHQTAAAVFFDVKKAFDKCVHNVLLTKLEQDFNVPHYLLCWLRSYLADRSFRVSANGRLSERRPVLSGVPQGSVLGPLLFLCYIIDLAKVTLSAGCKIVAFADDLCIYKPVPRGGDFVDFQTDIDNVDACITKVFLSFHPSKCKVMLFSVAPREPTLPVPLSLGGVSLQLVSEWKYLGVMLDRKLSFVTQCRVSTIKAKRAIHVLCRKFRSKAPCYVLQRVYVTCILPALLYGVESCYPATDYCRKEYERVHRLMARYLTNDYQSSYSDLLVRLNWIPLWRRILSLRLRLFCKLFHLPLFEPLLPRATNRRSARLSHSRAIDLTASKVSISNLFLYSTCKLWNALSDAIVTLPFSRFCKYMSTCDLVNLLRSKRLLREVELR